jgi:hypothetical protein
MIKQVLALIPFGFAGYLTAGLFIPAEPATAFAQTIAPQVIAATPTDLEAFEATAVELNDAGFPTEFELSRQMEVYDVQTFDSAAEAQASFDSIEANRNAYLRSVGQCTPDAHCH